jgi:type I restriction enzyme S subunit
MSNSAVGANIQNLNQGLLSNHEISLPPLETQQKIASILSAYDDLIENNRKQIKLLEEAAQRLYKEWFVDLRFPGYENVAIVDGVPEGWRIGTLGDLGNIITGKTPSKKNERYYGSAIPFVKIPDMHDCIYPITTEECLSLEGANSQKNKFIPPESLIVSCIGTAGLVNIAFELCQTNQQINSIVVDTEKYDIDFIYYAMLILGKELNFHSKTSTAVPIVNKSSFSAYEICCPSLEEQKRIAFILSVLDRKIEENKEINENLAA